MKKIFSTLFFVFCAAVGWSQSYNKTDIRNYISTYSHVARVKMQEHKIPASITLAQGILESAAGMSELAVNANNHFGIKCHKSWAGATYHKDDDKKNECFRKYDSPFESFEDHSQFLKASRYAELFNLEITDYKGWAHGLKKAGYATEPQYAQRLIRIIEEYDLAQYDQPDFPSSPSNNSDNNNYTAKPESKPERESKPVETRVIRENFNGFTPVKYDYTLRTVYMNNGAYFVVAKQGDTFYDIAVDVQLSVAELRRYNDVPNKKYEPYEGEMIYLQQKKVYAEIGHHILKYNETLRSVAQRYGCRLSTIYKLNNIEKSEGNVEAGMRLQLKK